MSEPGLCVPLGGCAHESSCTSCNLLGRVSLLRNSRQDKDIRLAGCALPRGGYKGGRWSPVATVHRRPRRQPRPAPFEKLYYYFEIRNPPPTTVSPFLLHRQFVGGGRGVGRVTARDRKIPLGCARVKLHFVQLTRSSFAFAKLAAKNLRFVGEGRGECSPHKYPQTPPHFDIPPAVCYA